MANAVFCMIGAMVGAGFASGREIMQFFTQYGSFSWALIAFSSGLMAALVYWSNEHALHREESVLIRGFRALLYCAVGGGMAAAAGELAALTLPMHHARTVGMLITLMACAGMSGGSLRGMAWLGAVLIPVMICAFLLCLRVPGTNTPDPQPSFPSLIHAAGYCGLNAMPAGAVTVQAEGQKKRQKRLCVAIAAGLLFGGFLSLGNAALLPHTASLKDAALPVVMLLRGYGKTGFYLSAATLYLAVSTTLIASLRGLAAQLPGEHQHIWAALIAAGCAMIGFQEIVAKAYPVLGYLSLLILLMQKNPPHKGGMRLFV